MGKRRLIALGNNGLLPFPVHLIFPTCFRHRHLPEGKSGLEPRWSTACGRVVWSALLLKCRPRGIGIFIRNVFHRIAAHIPAKTIRYTAATGMLVVIAIAAFILYDLDDWLEVSDPFPGSIDLLFTLSGESTRLDYSKKLFERGACRSWLISDPDTGLPAAIRRQRRAAGDVWGVDTCQNTRSEIMFLKSFLGKTEWRSEHRENARRGDIRAIPKIGIVSNWYHMRRVKIIVEAFIPESRFSFYYFPVPSNYDTYRDRRKHWWRQKKVKDIALFELGKIVYFIINHPFHL